MNPTKTSGVAIYCRHTSDKRSTAFQDYLDTRRTGHRADGRATVRTTIDSAFHGTAATRSALGSVLDAASRDPSVLCIVVENSGRFRRDGIERAHAFNRPSDDQRTSPVKLKTK